ncbi:hypothetical protein B5S29_g5424 [[Candida] boidinii]|nr:hypothetical protein B5S29_g5424 [[Candida] boidinii]
MTSNITQNDIEKWLRSLRCEQYIEKFNKNNITPDIFPELDLDALKEIGIRKVGDRLKILLLIEKINVEILKGKLDPEKLYTGISSAADTLNSTLEKIFIEKSENTKPQYIVAISQYGSAIKLNVENCYSALSVKQRALKYLEKSDAYSSNSNIYNYYSNNTPVSASQSSFFSDTSATSTIQATTALPINYDCYVIEQENGSYHKLFDVELVTLCHSKTLNEKEKCIVICSNDDFPSEDSIKTYNKIQNLNNLNSIPFAGNQSLEKKNSVRYNNNYPDLPRPKSQLGYHYNNTSTSNYSNQTLTSSNTNISNMPPHPFDHDMKDFMGQRPPSQVISINLAEYFPETRANELKEVMRNSVRLSMYGAKLHASSGYLNGGANGPMVNGFGHSHTNSAGNITPHIPIGSSSPSSVASSSPPPAGSTVSPHAAAAHGNNNILELPSFIPPSYKRSSVSTVSSIGSRLSTFSTYSVGTATQVPTVGDVLLNNSNAVETVLNTDKYGNSISKSGSLRRQHSHNTRPGSTIAMTMEESNYFADKRHRSLSRHHSTSNNAGSSSLSRGKSTGSNHATSSPTPLSHSYSNRRSVNGSSALRQSYSGVTDDTANTTQVSIISLRRQESNSAAAKAKRLSRFSVSTFGSTNNDMLPLAKSLTLDGEFDDHDFFDDDDIDNYVEREFLNHSGEHILSDPHHQTILEDDKEDIHSSNSAEKLRNSNINDENKMFNLKGLSLSSENLLSTKGEGEHDAGQEEGEINEKSKDQHDDSVDADTTEEDYYKTPNTSNVLSDEEAANRKSSVIELFEDGAFDEDPINAPDDLIERLALENESGPSVWHKGARIGQGSFGTVYLGLNGITGELMAVKQVEVPEEVIPSPSLTNSTSKDSGADFASGAGVSGNTSTTAAAASSSDNLTLGNKLSISTLAAPPKKNKDGKNEAEKKGNTMINALRQEMLLLRELNHENIVRYLGSSSDDKFLYIFLEYIPGGSVSSMLNTYGPFEEPLIRNFVTQVLVGLKYLHGEGIIHRDIKGANILIDINGTVKISDFGISKKIRSARKIDGKNNSDTDDADSSDTSENEINTLDDYYQTNNNSKKRASLQGSVYWMAPEVVKQIAYTDRADIWSLGCLIVEMFTGKHPYPGFSQMQAIFRIGTLIVPETPSWATIQAKDFLTLALEPDYKSRTDAAGLLTHPFNTPLISSSK